MRTIPAIAVAAALAATAASTSAETIYGITQATSTTSVQLVRFDSATPLNDTLVASITGITAGQNLTSIDFRPSNGLLYGISSSLAAAQLYTINTTTGAATAVGGALALNGNTSGVVSIDFNPVADALRVITGDGLNFRVNANTGALIQQDTTLTPSPTNVITATAYSNNVAGATQTTLYGYDYTADAFITIGSAGGSPNSPNTGIKTTIGRSGYTFLDQLMGMDISGATGIAYVAADDGNSADDNSEFYRVNLATGAATLVGNMRRDLSDISVAITPVPEPSQLALLLAGAGVVGAAVRRRRNG